MQINKRLSSTVSRHSSVSSQAASSYAPSVWVIAEWAENPIIEDYYGPPTRGRFDSYYDIMISPRIPDTATTTLGENAMSYPIEDDESDQYSAYLHSGRVYQTPNSMESQHSRKEYKGEHYDLSYSSNNEDDLERDTISSLSSQLNHENILSPRKYSSWKHMSKRINTSESMEFVPTPTSDFMDLPTRIYICPECQRYRSNTCKVCSNLNSMKIQDSSQSIQSVFSSEGYLSPLKRNDKSLQINTYNSSIQSDTLMKHTSRSISRSTSENRRNIPSFHKVHSSSMLLTKLHESLAEVDDKLTQEVSALRKVASQRCNRPPTTSTPKIDALWSFFCGIPEIEFSKSNKHADDLSYLLDELKVAWRTRSFNQLNRQRKQLKGILQIVSCHNPDLELTGKQLDSFDSPSSMLEYDMKVSWLQQQVFMLENRVKQRKLAHHRVLQRYGFHALSSQREKCNMMAKLLEAVSWYRLVQSNNHKQQIETIVNTSDKSSTNSLLHKSVFKGRHKSLQETQVDQILNVLHGEDFYADYGDLMCLDNWWDIAQAHFETLIFSDTTSKICKLIRQMTRDFVDVSAEDLDEVIDGVNTHRTGKQHKLKLRQVYSRGEYQNTDEVMYNFSVGPDSTNINISTKIEDLQPQVLLEFIEKFTALVRQEFSILPEVDKSLNNFIQRTIYPRMAGFCFNLRTMRECQRKDTLWRKKVKDLRTLSMESLNVPLELAQKIRDAQQNSNCNKDHLKADYESRVYLSRSIDAFNQMDSIVPCDLLAQMMHAVMVLHHELEIILETPHISIEAFFPLLVYVLIYCQLPRIHAQLHLLENFAIHLHNINGEDSYYVYCVHAAVEYICNSSDLTISHVAQTSEVNSPTSSSQTPKKSNLNSEPVSIFSAASIRK